MKTVICLAVALAAVVIAASGEQQRILRRVIKSTPTATNLGRVRLVTVRSVAAERGAVSEITSKEAASFGQRSANETSAGAQQQPAPTKTKKASPSTTTAASPTTTTSISTSTPSTTTSTAPTPTTAAIQQTRQQTEPAKPKASERQQAAEVELLASAPSSWQPMTAVEAPAAALIAAGTRPAVASSQQDLSSAASAESNDFLRASSSKTNYNSQSAAETFSRLRQQTSKTSQQQQQQSFFYPQQQQQQQRAQSKTSNYQQATKTHWYQPSTTPRPAPIVQEQQYEQYVEQQQVEAAPPGQAEPFAFDFNTQDNSGNGQYRKEESDKNGVVRGSYGYTDANGIYRHVDYVADHNGFRANIKSNEPGLIGETQPASIRLDGGPAPASPATNQRFTSTDSVTNNDSGEWTASSSSSNERADLALAPPDFESAHKSERLRAPRHFRN